MISTFAIVTFALFQAALLVGTSILLFFAHRRTERFQREVGVGVDLLREPIRRLMMREDQGEALAASLESLDDEVATSLLLRLAGSRLGAEEVRKLAPLLRRAPWVERVLRHGRSRTWWRRMDAARLLAVVGVPDDRALVADLLFDPHPAVASAASELLQVHADAKLVEAVIRHLPTSCSAGQQMRALRGHAELTTTILVQHLAEPATDEELVLWIQLAEVLATPAALGAVIPYAWHDSPSVRATVARALRVCFLPSGVKTSHVMLHDDDWTVRASAARALGALRATNAVHDLRTAMSDVHWWVRFRAGLALRALGDAGDVALQQATTSGDRYARDMAVVVLGLSEASRIELSA